MKFDENLRQMRRKNGYSQEELSEKLGVTRQTVSKWENGSAMPELKKLTEIAEFFDVSMDDLLGIEYGSNSALADGDRDFERYAQYINQLVLTIGESNNRGFKKMMIPFVAVIAVVVCALIVGCFSFAGEIRNTINHSIGNLQSQTSEKGVFAETEEENGISDFITVTLKKTFDSPYSVEAEFRYSPISYPKGTKVYFSVPEANNTVKKMEATEENGEFFLTTPFDISIDGEYFIFIESDEENIKKKFFFSLIDLYCTFDYTYGQLYYSLSKEGSFLNPKYVLKSDLPDYDLYWQGIPNNKISKAEFIVERENGGIFSKELDYRLTQTNGRSLITLKDFQLNSKPQNNYKAYVKVTDEQGNIYIFYVNLDTEIKELSPPDENTAIIISDSFRQTYIGVR